MKTRTIPILCLSTLLLSGCIASRVGTHIENYNAFNPSGHGSNRVTFKNQYAVDYSYTINENDKTLTMSGQFVCLENTANWEDSEGTVTVMFVSSKKIILDRQVLKFWANEELCTPKPFNRTYPLLADTSGVRLHIRGTMRE